MQTVNSNVVKLLDLMYPGQDEFPNWSSLAIPIDTTFGNCAREIEATISKLKIDFRTHEDINGILRQIKNANLSLYNEFIEISIEAYFSHPDILLLVQPQGLHMYPNQHIIKDINYDLLVPVINIKDSI